MSQSSIVEAQIGDLQEALTAGRINAVQLLAKHLHRIAQYDRRGPLLNAIPIINLRVFDHAQESDEYRARSDGSIRSPLEGIPCTVKDSYMMEGLTVASGSPAFKDLTASTDAFTVSRIRQGGGVVIGKTNMPPMANGGMQRGVYGRAESPYNKDYLAAAFASGSSNGAGSSAAASMSVFAMAEETVSSGRSPASNNGLVAYTPSPGIISIRGNWPLFPIADVVVPFSRTVNDMLVLLDVIVAEDQDKTCDFWRGQPFIPIPSVSEVRPKSYGSLADATSLRGKRIGVPKMYIGKDDPTAQPVWTSNSVCELWETARATLESLGATVEEVDFPLVTNIESKPGSVAWETEYPAPGDLFGETGPPGLFEQAWDDFLGMVNDKTSITTLAEVDPSLIFPQLPGTLPDRYGNQFGDRLAESTAIVQAIASRTGDIFKVPGLEARLKTAEEHRKRDLDDWMDKNEIDALVWPAAGDVAAQDAETDDVAAEFAWRNGVYFSNGNCVIRQLGVPTVTVPMGLLQDKKMPVGLTFASKPYDDNALLSYAYAFEQAHGKRPLPPRTPGLDTDNIPFRNDPHPLGGKRPPRLEATARRLSENSVEISGRVNTEACGDLETIEIFVDGIQCAPVHVNDESWSVIAPTVPYQGVELLPSVQFINTPELSKAMIVIVATARNGRSDGKLLFA